MSLCPACGSESVYVELRDGLRFEVCGMPNCPYNKRLPSPPEKTVDLVNHPPHYNQGSVECIDAIQSALSKEGFIGFLRGQIIKYTWRMGLKNASLQEAEKVEWYNNRLIKELKDVQS